MIALQRTGGNLVYLNPDLIETCERADGGATTVVLTTGNALVVSEDCDRIVELIVAYRRRLGTAR
jgi:uncharacterized protein YlzI (FlbEa/FlbD family)